MSDLEEARILLAAAAIDLEALSAMVARPPFPDRSVGFYAQQCAEKCLKAWLAALADSYPTVHSIRRLLDELSAIGETTGPWQALSHYTPFAGWIRYGDAKAEQNLPPVDHGQALAEAQHIYDHVEALVARVAARAGGQPPAPPS